jgi:hypothetical protein
MVFCESFCLRISDLTHSPLSPQSPPVLIKKWLELLVSKKNLVDCVDFADCVLNDRLYVQQDAQMTGTRYYP